MSELQISRLMSGAGSICAEILGELPDWFGIEEANRSYARAADANPTVVARAAGRSTGFLTSVRHTERAAELLVMGVRPEHHGTGVGTALLTEAETWLREDGVAFLQVKTLADEHPDEGYRATRAFYRGRGFVDLEVLPDLWDAANPALIMIKAL